MNALTDAEMCLLKDIGKGFMQYGECYGKTFELLKAKGLVQIHGPGEHQTGFIAQDHAGTKGLKYRAVSLTDDGIVMLAGLKEGRHA